MKNSFLLIGICFSFLLCSCITMADYNFSHIDRALEAGNFDAVFQELEHPSGILYTSHDQVLSNFDKGLILHYAGRYKESNKYFSEAEKLIEKYQAKSFTQAIGSIVTNDTVKDYAGGLYEDIYANIFMAMNYIQLQDHEDAFVELRRIDNKLKEYNTKYQKEIEKNKLALSKNAQSVPTSKNTFYNSAFARYLSMLMYRSENDFSNAELDYKFIKKAFSEQKSVYSFAVPKSISNEYSKQNEPRLNIIAFSGLGPIKEEVSTPIFAEDGFYRIALPQMKSRNSQITGVKVTATNTKTGKNYFADSEKIESIDSIIQETYKSEYSLIVSRTIGRMVAKLTTTIALDSAAKEVSDSSLSLIFSLAGLVSKVNMFASERADVRMCRYFPKNAFISGISVPAGTYDIKIEYKSKSKTIHTVQLKNKIVSAKKLNIEESFCLK